MSGANRSAPCRQGSKKTTIVFPILCPKEHLSEFCSERPRVFSKRQGKEGRSSPTLPADSPPHSLLSHCESSPPVFSPAVPGRVSTPRQAPRIKCFKTTPKPCLKCLKSPGTHTTEWRPFLQYFGGNSTVNTGFLRRVYRGSRAHRAECSWQGIPRYSTSGALDIFSSDQATCHFTPFCCGFRWKCRFAP